MAKTLLSFLGNNQYLPCHYTWQGDPTNLPESKFVQVAIAQHFCKDWGKEDRIVILLTGESAKNNWEDGGFNKSGRTGLKSELNTVADSIRKERGQCFEIIPVPGIPEGFSIEDGWRLIRLLLDQIREGDEIILDVTHGFRTLPMLSLSFLNYANMVKNTSVAHILYGAFEEKGGITEEERTGQFVRQAPIFDYTPILQLNQWVAATSDFIHRGDGNSLDTLSKQAKAQAFLSTKPDDPILKHFENLKSFSRLLALFSNNVRAARGNAIFEEDAHQRQEVFESARSVQDRLPLLGGLIDRLQSELSEYEKGSWKNGLLAARWCASRNMVPQAYTILQETIFTALAKTVKANPLDEDHRNAVSYALQYAAHPNPKDYDGKEEEVFNNSLAVVQSLPSLVVKSIDTLRKRRNDINHAGFIKEKADAEKLLREINRILEAFTPETVAQMDQVLRIPS